MSNIDLKKQSIIECAKADLKKHPWYEDYPDEEIAKMAENIYERELRRIEKRITEREITCSNYRRAQKRLDKELIAFTGK